MKGKAISNWIRSGQLLWSHQNFLKVLFPPGHERPSSSRASSSSVRELPEEVRQLVPESAVAQDDKEGAEGADKEEASCQ